MYMDTSSFKWSKKGCSLISHENDKIICSCTHTTTFGTFLDQGYSVLAYSNFDVILALQDINIDGLKSNIGFIFSFVFLICYLIIGLILCHCDRIKIKRNYK